jgi:hypothetical protein
LASLTSRNLAFRAMLVVMRFPLDDFA